MDVVAGDADRVDDVVHHDAVLKLERLAADRITEVDRQIPFRVEIGECAAEIALEEQLADGAIEAVVPMRRGTVGVAGEPARLILIEWVHPGQQALGSRQLQVGIGVEPVGPFGDRPPRRAVAEDLHRRAVIAVDPEARLPHGAARHVDTGRKITGVKKAVAEFEGQTRSGRQLVPGEEDRRDFAQLGWEASSHRRSGTDCRRRRPWQGRRRPRSRQATPRHA